MAEYEGPCKLRTIGKRLVWYSGFRVLTNPGGVILSGAAFQAKRRISRAVTTDLTKALYGMTRKGTLLVSVPLGVVTVT